MYEYEYIGLPGDPHEHHHDTTLPGMEEPKTFAEFIKPEYRYK